MYLLNRLFHYVIIDTHTPIIACDSHPIKLCLQRRAENPNLYRTPNLANYHSLVNIIILTLTCSQASSTIRKNVRKHNIKKQVTSIRNYKFYIKLSIKLLRISVKLTNIHVLFVSKWWIHTNIVNPTSLKCV